MPRWLTEREQKVAQEGIDRLGELPFLSQFSQTEEGRLGYYKIIPDPVDPAGVILFRVVVAGFWIFSLGFAALLLRRDRMALLLRTPELVLILLAVHASYLGTDAGDEEEVRDLGFIVDDHDDRRIMLTGDRQRLDAQTRGSVLLGIAGGLEAHVEPEVL